jgi:hypothetical protein
MMPDDPLADAVAAKQAILAAQTASATLQVDNLIALTDYFKPPGALYETVPKFTPQDVHGGRPNTATLTMQAIGLPGNLTISSITFVGVDPNYPVGQTHLWFALLDDTYNLLAVTKDDGAAGSWATAAFTLPIATTAAGATTSFTTTYSGLHYVGITNAAATPIQLNQTAAPIGWATPPWLMFDSTAALTGPPAFPFTAAGPTSFQNGLLYAYVS